MVIRKKTKLSTKYYTENRLSNTNATENRRRTQVLRNFEQFLFTCHTSRVTIATHLVISDE